MNVRFYIERRKDGDGKLMVRERPVFMRASFRGQRVMIGTGMRVDFHGWDPERQRVRSTFPGAHAANAWLDVHVETAELTWKALSGSREGPDPVRFRDVFLELRPRFSRGFFDVFFLFLESGVSRWSASTYRKVRTIYNHLRAMEEETGIRLTFQQMNGSFLERFQTFCRKKGYSPATIRNEVGILVWFLNWATEQGYNIHREYRKFYSMLEPAGSPSGEVLSLQWEELMKILHYQSGNRKTDRIRDIFCFMCFTGIRFSELRNLKKQDVGEDAVIVRRSKGQSRRLPLTRYSREIYRCYEHRYYMDNTAFPAMSVITVNKYLKRIAMEAGLNRKVKPVKAGETDVPLHERITAGIAVNTFIAHALALDIPMEVISGFTGVRHDSRVRRMKEELGKKEIARFDSR